MKIDQGMVCLALALSGGPAIAGQDGSNPNPDLSQLIQRLERLEESNRQLQHRLAGIELDEKGEAMATRLADLEIELLSLRKQARAIETIEGISAGAAITMVAQKATTGETVEADSQLNYRADVSVTLPGGEIGDAAGHLFAHFRIGQGEGLNFDPPGFSSTTNSTTFQLSEGDDSAAVLAQVWYQLDVPLNGAGVEPGRHLEFNFGKIDPFVFFDQNAIADDETSRFLNNAFVHNPLLDSGGAVGVDGYGFTPGARLAFHREGTAGDCWRMSLGVFGAGDGASFSNGFEAPFLIAQLESERRLFDGLPGNYRVYAWSNGSATPYANPLDPDLERHSGWGLSVDQRVTVSTTLFVRYGHSTEGRVRFDQAFTAGLELNGAAWGRGNDRLGLAGGWLRASGDFSADAPVLDADGVEGADFGYQPDGAERLAELYYAWHVNDQLELTPDLQWVSRPGADGSADDRTIVGLRATLGF